MSKDTLQYSFNQLEKLEKDLRRCQQRLDSISRARLPVYLIVPSDAHYLFQALYYCIRQLKEQLR